MKEYYVYVIAEDGFKAIKVKATGADFTGSLLVFMNGQNIVAQFLVAKVIGYALSENVS